MPFDPTVTAIAAPTPNGARYMTYFVYRNITSASDSANCNDGLRRSSDACAGGAEKEREDNDLQHFAARHRIDDAGGKRVLQDRAEALLCFWQAQLRRPIAPGACHRRA